MSGQDMVEGLKSGGIMLHNTISSLYDANVNQTALHEDVMKKLERMDEKCVFFISAVRFRPC